MKSISEAMKAYMLTHPFDSGNSDCQTVLDQLYHAYAESHEHDPQEIGDGFKELEEYLYKLDVINECVVVAREVGGETLLTAVVYPEYTRFEGADAEQIKETIKAEIMAVNKHLPVFKQIRNIEIKKNEFEKTTSKKIIRYKV